MSVGMKYGDTLRQRSIPEWGHCEYPRPHPRLGPRRRPFRGLTDGRMQTTLITTTSRNSSSTRPRPAPTRPSPSQDRARAPSGPLATPSSGCSRSNMIASTYSCEARAARSSGGWSTSARRCSSCAQNATLRAGVWQPEPSRDMQRLRRTSLGTPLHAPSPTRVDGRLANPNPGLAKK